MKNIAIYPMEFYSLGYGKEDKRNKKEKEDAPVDTPS